MDLRSKAKILGWFNASEAAKIGIELAEKLVPGAANPGETPANKLTREILVGDLQMVFQQAERQLSGLSLNFFKKAKLANSFKWRLLESGVEGSLADEITQGLVLQLSGARAPIPLGRPAVGVAADRLHSGATKHLMAQANRCMAQGDYSEAIGIYEELIRSAPRDAIALNNLGAALSKLGRYKDAEECFRRAVEQKPDYSDAYSNLGTVLRWRGFFAESLDLLRRAVKLNPKNADARVNLGMCLALANRTRDARAHFAKVLKAAPRNADALFGMALIDKSEGRFEASSVMLGRVLEARPDMPSAWASLASVRRMTSSDSLWQKKAEEIAAGGNIPPIEEAELRFAIGKYHDDLGNFSRAFESYQRANELLKTIADPYDRDSHKKFVDESIGLFGRDFAKEQGAHASEVPVLVVGMPRSGTSLVEQIIASHPAAKGAGEVDFWSQVMHREASALKEGGLDEARRTNVADEYLRILRHRVGDATRIVDKAPVNSDYLGLIHSIFPNARIIYMQRDPIDTCLSCYFQNFPVSQNFTLDLGDLSHYYQEHHRLMNHWRRVLPSERLLEVSYAGLVGDPAEGTRKILEFLGLPWDERCLNFQTTARPVVTASSWQVRQKIYGTSVQRWRNYERYLGPLLKLRISSTVARDG